KLIVGVIVLSITWQVYGPDVRLIYGVPFILVFALFEGLRIREIEIKLTPGEGFRRSIRNATLVGSSFGLSFGLSSWLVHGATLGFIWGLFFGLVGWLLFGGIAFIQHSVLRFLLFGEKHIPWAYDR